MSIMKRVGDYNVNLPQWKVMIGTKLPGLFNVQWRVNRQHDTRLNVYFGQTCSIYSNLFFMKCHITQRGLYCKSTINCQSQTLLLSSYLCLKGETNWQYWQLYLSSLLNSAMAEWLLSWDLSPCMDMKTLSHWAHGWPPATNRCFSSSSDAPALAAATRAAALPSASSVSGSSVSMSTPSEAAEKVGPIVIAAGLSRHSASVASSPSRLPLVRLSEGRVRGTSLTSCCKTKRTKFRCPAALLCLFVFCQTRFYAGVEHRNKIAVYLSIT